MATKKNPPPFSLENIPIELINQEFARRYGQGYSDFGKRFTFGPGKAVAGAEVGPVIPPPETQGQGPFPNGAPDSTPYMPFEVPPAPSAPWKTPGRRPFDFARQALQAQQGAVQSPDDFAREVQQATQSYRAGERAAAEPVRNIAPGFVFNEDMFNPVSDAGQSFVRPPENPIKQVEPPKYRGVPVEQRGAEQILNSALEAEAQKYPDITGADLQTWQAQHPMKPEDRTKIARAIGAGAIDVTSIPPEAVPWAELLNEPGYQTIGKVGMHDPEKAYQWLPNLQQTISKQGLEGMYKERDRLNADIADLKGDPNKLAKAILEMRLLPEDVAQMAADSQVLQQTLRVFADTPDLGKLGSIGKLGVTDPVAGRNALLEYMQKQENNEWNRMTRGLKTGATTSLLRGLQKPTVYPQSGIEEGANFAGSLLAELPWVMLAAQTGGTAAANIGTRLNPALARQIALAEMTGTELPLAARMQLGTMQGLGTGAGVAFQKETGEFLSSPERYSVKEGLQRSAETVGEYGLFGAAYPAVGQIGQAAGEFVGPKIAKSAVGQSRFGQTVKRIVENDPFYLPSIGKYVAEKGTGGAVAGGLVGVAKATGEAIVQGAQDPRNVSMRRFAETVLTNLKEEFTEEMLEAITYGLVQGEFKATHSDVQKAAQKANSPRLRAAIERARASSKDRQANAEEQRLYWIEDMYRQMTDKTEADKALVNPAPVQYREMPEAAHTWADTRKSTGAKQWAQDFVQNLETWNGEGNPSLPEDDRGLPQRDRMAMAAYLRGHVTQATASEAQRAWTSKEFWKLTPQEYISLVKAEQYGPDNEWWTPQEATGWMRDHAAYVQAAIFDGQELPDRVKQYYPNIEQQTEQTPAEAPAETGDDYNPLQDMTPEEMALMGDDFLKQMGIEPPKAPATEQAVRTEPGPSAPEANAAPAPPIVPELTQKQLDEQSDKEAEPEAAMPSTVIDEEAPPVETPATPKEPSPAPAEDRSSIPDPGDMVTWTAAATGQARDGRVVRRDEDGWMWVKGSDGETKKVHEGDLRISNKAPQYKAGDKIRWTLGDNKYTGTVIEAGNSSDNKVGVNWDVPEGTKPIVTNLLKHFIDGYAEDQAQGQGKPNEQEQSPAPDAGQKAPDKAPEPDMAELNALTDKVSRMASDAVYAVVKEKHGNVPDWTMQARVKAQVDFRLSVDQLTTTPDDSAINGLFMRATNGLERTTTGIQAGFRLLDHDLVRQYHQAYRAVQKGFHDQKRAENPRSAAIDEVVELPAAERTRERFKQILDSYDDSVMPSLLEWADDAANQANVPWWKDVVPLIKERIAGNVDQRGKKAPDQKQATAPDTQRTYDQVRPEFSRMVSSAMEQAVVASGGNPFLLAEVRVKSAKTFRESVEAEIDPPSDWTVDRLFQQAIKTLQNNFQGVAAGVKALDYNLVREYYQAVKAREAGGTDQSKGAGQSKPDERTDINAEGIDQATTGKIENLTQAIHTLRASFVHVKMVGVIGTVRVRFSARIPENVKSHLKGAGLSLHNYGTKETADWAYEGPHSPERETVAEALMKYLPKTDPPTVEELTSDEQLKWYMSGRMVQTTIGRDGRPQLRTIDQATGKPVAANAHDAFKLAMQANGWRLTNGVSKKDKKDKQPDDWYWTPLSDSVLAKANDFGRRLAEVATGESKAKPEAAPEQPATQPGEAPPEPTGKPPEAPPTFNEGDRVTWTNRKGERLTGTVKYEGVTPDHVEVRVDQIARAGGVPILRSEQWPIAEMQHLQSEKPAPDQDQAPDSETLTPAEQATERKKAYFSATQRADDLDAIAQAKPDHVLLSFANWEGTDIQNDFLDRVGYRPTIIVDSGAYTFYNDKVDTGFEQLMTYFMVDMTLEPGGVIKFVKDAAVSDRKSPEDQDEFGLGDDDDFITDEEPTGLEGLDVDPLIINKFMGFIDFLDANKGNYDHYINFDTIGDPELSAYAYEVMKAGGYNPMPVFQPGVDVAELDKLVADGEKYIALGGTAMRKTMKPSDVVAWVKPILQRHPGVKFHLLGSHNIRQIINHLPELASYDGSAWIKSAGYKKNGDPGQTKVEKAVDNINRHEGRPKGTTGIDGEESTGKDVRISKSDMQALLTGTEWLDVEDWKKQFNIEDGAFRYYRNGNVVRVQTAGHDATGKIVYYQKAFNLKYEDGPAPKQVNTTVSKRVYDLWRGIQQVEQAFIKSPDDAGLKRLLQIRGEKLDQEAKFLGFTDGNDLRRAIAIDDPPPSNFNEFHERLNNLLREMADIEAKPKEQKAAADAEYQQVIEYVRGAADPATGIFNQGLARMLGQNLFGDKWSQGDNGKVVSGYVRRLVDDGIVTAPMPGKGYVLATAEQGAPKEAAPATDDGLKPGQELTLSIPLSTGKTMDMDAIYAAPGLAVHLSPEKKNQGKWTITHISSGIALTTGYDSEKQALAAAKRFSEVRNWDVPKGELLEWIQDDANKATMQKLIEQTKQAVPNDAKGAKPNGANKVRTDGEGSLEEVPPEGVRGAGANGRADGGSSGSGRANGERNGGTDRTGNDTGRGVGGDTGEVHPETGGEVNPGTRRPRAGTKQVVTDAKRQEERTPRRFYRFAPDENPYTGGKKTKYKANVAAIKLLKQLQAEGRMATPEEQKILIKYVGWGGIKNAFTKASEEGADDEAFTDDSPEEAEEEAKGEWDKEKAELRELLTKDEYRAARKSTQYAHYTSPEVVKAMWRLVDRLGFNGRRILEPAMGTGNFFGLMPERLVNTANITGIEFDPITAGIAKQLYQGGDIRHMGFEDAIMSKGMLGRDYYDLAIGNPPFAKTVLYDPDYSKYRFKMHDYFTAKSLDAVRPGGLLVFVTGAGSMNSQDDTIRTYLQHRADFVGAIRLPNSAFKKNAGTEVTTDIIILQKREPNTPPSPLNQKWLTVVDSGLGSKIAGKTLFVNEYFKEHPEMMLGRLSEDKLHPGRIGLQDDGRDFAAALDEAIQRFPEAIFKKQEHKATEAPEPMRIPKPTDKRPFSYFLDKDGELYQARADTQADKVLFVPRKDGSEAAVVQRIKGMIEVRDAARAVHYHQANNDSDAVVEAAQKRFFKVYNSFVKQFGYIHKPANTRAFRQDPELAFLLGIEKWDPDTEKGEPVDMFTKRTINVFARPTTAKDAQDALNIALSETGQVDFNRMRALTGKSDEELQGELRGQVFYTPQEEWQTKEQYLSGNVRAKLREAVASAQNDDRFWDNVEALKAVQPTDLVVGEVKARLGSHWVHPTFYQDFVAHLLEGDPEAPPVRITRLAYTGQWTVQKNEDANFKNVLLNTEWGTKERDTFALVDLALNQRTAKVMKDSEDGETRVPDPVATDAANLKLAKLKKAFGEWLWTDPDRTAALLEHYNENFNNMRLAQWDGSHMQLPGAVTTMGGKPYEWRTWQKNAIWRIVQNGNMGLFHVVGAGKTNTMIAAGMEMRRMGIAKKPMYVVPNHLVEQWGGDFTKLYPGAKVKVAAKEDFKRENRQRLFVQIATGDWDAVIVPHSSFGFIPMSKAAQVEFLQEQTAEIDQAIAEAKLVGDEDSRTVSQLEAQKEQLENKIKSLLAAEKKDDILDFEQLGVDALFLDEAHEFKNLYYPTSMERISGIQNAGNQKTLDLFMKVRWLNKLMNYRTVVMATGTPLSNTLGEMFTMQRYLQLKALQDYNGVDRFDAWASTFTVPRSRLEVTPDGADYRVHTRLSRFINLPELMNLFNQVADIQTIETIPALKKVRPPLITGRFQEVMTPLTEGLKAYVAGLKRRLELYKQASNKKEYQKTDIPLNVTTDGRHAALDLRLRDPKAEDHPDSKINIAVDKVYSIWDETKHLKGTQLIFSDLGAPVERKPSKDKEGNLRNAKRRWVDEDGFLHIDILPPGAPQGSLTNVYQEVKDKLVARGIPANEIAFIHDAATDKAKEKLFRDVRLGRIRILMGSSQKMGAGMNVQAKLVALHHLDPTWRPLDIEQREGRILRPGNDLWEAKLIDGVRIFRYVTKGSFDAYMWETMASKAKFVSQVMSGQTGMRETDDIDGEDAPDDFDVMVGAASNNPLTKRRVIVRTELAQLDRGYSEWEKQRRRLQSEVASAPARNNMDKESIAKYGQDIARREDVQGDSFKMTLFTHLDGVKTQEFTDRDQAGTTLKALVNAGKSVVKDAIRDAGGGKQSLRLGSFGGFELDLRGDGWGDFQLTLRGNMTYESEDKDTGAGMLQSLAHHLRPGGIEKEIENIQKRMAIRQKDTKDMQEQLQRPFDGQEEMDKLQTELRQIEEDLGIRKKDEEEVTVSEAADEAPDDNGDDSGDDSGDDGELSGLRGLTANGANDDDGEDSVGELLGMARPRAKQKKDVWPGPHLTPKAAREAADILGKAVNAVIHGQKTRMRGAEGEFDYRSQSGRVKTRSLDDWRVVGHELAHGTDLATRFQGDPRELRQMARRLYPAQISGKKAEPEGLAEFLTLYVVNPKEADTRAHLTFQAWETFLAAHPDLGAAFARIRVTVDADLAGTPLERGMKITSWNRRPSIGPAVRRITRGGPGQAGTWYRRGLDELKAMAEGDRSPLTRGIGDYRVPLHQRLAFRVIDYTIPFQAFHDAASKNNYTGINLAKLGAIMGSGHKKAELDFTSLPRDSLGRFLPGRSLQQITQQAVDLIGNQLGWKKTTLSDGEEYGALEMFDAYLHARRAWERYTHAGHKSPTGATETDTNYPNRDFQTGLWMTEKHAQQIIDQIEKDFPGMDKLAQEFSETLSEVILTKLQLAGVIDGKTRQRVEKGSLSTHYLPTYYDEDVNWLMPPTGEAGRTANQPVGFFRGRVGAPKDFLTSVMAKLAEVEQSIEYKKVLDTIEAMGNTKGMGAFLEFEKAPYNKISLDFDDVVAKIDQLLNTHTGLSQVGTQSLDFWVRGGLKDFSGKDAVLMNWHGTKRVYMRLAPDLFQAVAAMRTPQISLVGRMLARIGRVQRYTGLANPVTMWNIFWRDIFTVGIQTEGDWKGNALGAAKTVSADMLQGWAKVAGIAANLDTELFDLYVSSGGFGGSMQHILETLSKGNHSDGMIYTRATGWKKAPLSTGGEILMRVLRTPEEMLRFMEEYPRLAEWMAVFKKEVDALNAGVTGDDVLEKVKKGQANTLPITVQAKLEKILVEAAYASHNITVNTALHGQADWIRSYVQTVPFMQGSIQGVYRFYNQVRQDPVKTGKRAAMYLVPMTLLAWAWMMAGDDEDKEWYNALPHETKDRYWVFRIPGTPLHFGIAKPYEYAIPINLMHRFLDWAKFHDTKHALDGLGKMVLTAMLPNDMVNSLVMNSIHLYANKDDAGNAITPMGEEGLAAYQATGPSTSKTAKLLSTIGANVADKPWQTLDARHWDYVIKNMIPGGKWALTVTDPIAGALGTQGPDSAPSDWIAAALGIGADTRTKGIEYAPVVGGLLWGRAERGNRKIDRFYTDIADARNWTKVVREASKGKAGAPPGITPQSIRLVRALPAMEAVAGEISALRKTMHNDLQDEGMTPAERKRYLLRYNYVQDMATAMLYGETPPPPPKEAELTPAKVVELSDYFSRKAQQAMIREASRDGGPTEIANAMAESLNAKGGR